MERHILQNEEKKSKLQQEILQIEEDIARVKPTHVVNAAGDTDRPNVDWCETHRPETIRANVVGVLVLADVTRAYNLNLVNYSTGCIFECDKHPEGESA